LFGGLLSLAWSWQIKEPQVILTWTGCTFVLMALSLLVIISNADQLSLRIQRDIPVSRLKRCFAFVFYNGAAGGLVWVAIITALTFGITLGIVLYDDSWFPKSRTAYVSPPTGSITSCAAALAYAFDYALTGLLIQRKFFPKRPPKLAGLLAVLIASGWAIVPSLVLFFLNELTWKSIEGLQLGNAFNVFSSLREGNELNLHLLFSGVWLVLVIVLNVNWFFRQMKAFRPPAQIEKPPAATEVPPII
jgi:hypothetical protein